MISCNLMVFLQMNLSSITSNIAVWRSIGLLDQPRSCEWSCFFHNCFEWESLVNLLRHADISVTITSKKKTLRGLVELMKPAIVERLHDLWPQQDAIEPTVPAAPLIQSVGHWLWKPTKINTVGQISTPGNEIYMINGEESRICLING